jgi:hypothetical protein
MKQYIAPTAIEKQQEYISFDVFILFVYFSQACVY